jgi:hypothetical protein
MGVCTRQGKLGDADQPDFFVCSLALSVFGPSSHWVVERYNRCRNFWRIERFLWKAGLKSYWRWLDSTGKIDLPLRRPQLAGLLRSFYRSNPAFSAVSGQAMVANLHGELEVSMLFSLSCLIDFPTHLQLRVSLLPMPTPWGVLLLDYVCHMHVL